MERFFDRFGAEEESAIMGLLGITLVLGSRVFGAKNWIILGPLSFQPSEIAKICYIFAGSATLERLFRRRNLTLFIILTGVCIGCLGLMSDFGTAAIFFVTFLVIAYLRSGDFATLGLICGAAVFGAGIIVKFKPYILGRFATWGHACESGFQLPGVLPDTPFIIDVERRGVLGRDGVQLIFCHKGLFHWETSQF